MELVITRTDKGFEWNNEEIKQEITSKVAYYGELVYDEEQIKEAKADRADLNRFKTALEDKRKEIKKAYLAPYEKFEKEVKEIVKILEEPIAAIDSQVRAFEEKKKQEKQDEIVAYIETKDLHGFNWTQIFNIKWLNATTSMKSITEEIDNTVAEIDADINILTDLSEYSFEALEKYKETRDVRQALAEAKRLTEMAKAKAEYEARQQAEAEARAAEAEARAAEVTPAPVTEPEPVIEPEPIEDDFLPNFEEIENTRTWVVIKAFANEDDLAAIKAFMDSRSVPFETIGD